MHMHIHIFTKYTKTTTNLSPATMHVSSDCMSVEVGLTLHSPKQKWRNNGLLQPKTSEFGLFRCRAKRCRVAKGNVPLIEFHLSRLTIYLVACAGGRGVRIM